MPKLTQLSSGQISCYIYCGDHIPPHVHFVSTQNKWVLKVSFDYALDQEMNIIHGIQIVRGQPQKSDINDCIDQLLSKFSVCKSEWWKFANDVGLKNKELDIHQNRFKHVSGKTNTSFKVASSCYLHVK